MLEDLLRKSLLAVLEKYGVFEEDVQVELEKPRERSHGDLSTNLALVLGKRLGRKPRELAGEIAADIKFPREVIESVEIAGPGFINFRIARRAPGRPAARRVEPGGALANIQTAGGKRINVEFISANPTGPLNVVSARAGAFGMTMVRLLEAVGYDAHAEYYVNDAGRQVELLGQSLRARYLQLLGEPVEFPEDGYHGQYLEIMAAGLLEQDERGHPRRLGGVQRRELPAGCRAERLRRRLAAPAGRGIVRCFSKYALMTILGWQRETCRRFGLRFDTWYFESELHETKRLDRALERLRKLEAVYEEDGAVWFKSTDARRREGPRRGAQPTAGRPTSWPTSPTTTTSSSAASSMRSTSGAPTTTATSAGCRAR
jgi:arginyl-tRNA synthetase